MSVPATVITVLAIFGAFLFVFALEVVILVLVTSFVCRLVKVLVASFVVGLVYIMLVGLELPSPTVAIADA